MANLSDHEVVALLRAVAEAFASAGEVFEEYEKRFLREASTRGLLRPADIEACMWIADRLAGEDDPFPLIRTLRLEGYLTRRDIGRLHGDLMTAVQ
jgi:hypothetical protein